MQTIEGSCVPTKFQQASCATHSWKLLWNPDDRNRLLHARVCSVLSAVFIFCQSSILIRWKASFCAIKLLTSTSAREIPCGERLTSMYKRSMSTVPSCRFLNGCKNCWKENGRFLCQMEICWDWIFCGGGLPGAYVGWVSVEVYRKKSKYFRSQPLRSSF